jgi:hypothetical protein
MAANGPENKDQILGRFGHSWPVRLDAVPERRFQSAAQHAMSGDEIPRIMPDAERFEADIARPQPMARTCV